MSNSSGTHKVRRVREEEEARLVVTGGVALGREKMCMEAAGAGGL